MALYKYNEFGRRPKALRASCAAILRATRARGGPGPIGGRAPIVRRRNSDPRDNRARNSCGRAARVPALSRPACDSRRADLHGTVTPRACLPWASIRRRPDNARTDRRHRPACGPDPFLPARFSDSASPRERCGLTRSPGWGCAPISSECQVRDRRFLAALIAKLSK